MHEDQGIGIDEEVSIGQERINDTLHKELITSKKIKREEIEGDNLSESSNEDELSICTLYISERIIDKYKETIGTVLLKSSPLYKARHMITDRIKTLIATGLISLDEGNLRLRKNLPSLKLGRGWGSNLRTTFKLRDEGKCFDAYTIFPYDLESTLDQVFQKKLLLATSEALARNEKKIKNQIVDVDLTDDGHDEEIKIVNNEGGSSGLTYVSDRTRTSEIGVAEAQKAATVRMGATGWWATGNIKGHKDSLVDIDARVDQFKNPHSSSPEQDHLDILEQKISQDFTISNRSISTRISDLNSANIQRGKELIKEEKKEKKEMKRKKDEKIRIMEGRKKDKNKRKREQREIQQLVGKKYVNFQYGNELLSCSPLFFLFGALGSRLVLEALQVCLQTQLFYVYKNYEHFLRDLITFILISCILNYLVEGKT
jgi:hypothetical protein